MKALINHLKAARHIEFFAALIVLALIAMLFLNAQDTPTESASPLEQRLERLLSSMDGAGRVRVMVTEGDDGHIAGVVVVAEGLDSVRTALEMQSAVKTLLDIDTSRVQIIGRGGSYGGIVP